MSEITGGRADKFGNAFERLWIVRLALDVVEGRATSIKWEPLGPEGAGIECIVTRPDESLEKHQCKIVNGTTAQWSAADLDEVLKAAKDHLEADPCAQFVFVSKDPARVTCPPNPDPSVTLGSRIEEDRNGTQEAHSGADHPQAA